MKPTTSRPSIDQAKPRLSSGPKSRRELEAEAAVRDAAQEAEWDRIDREEVGRLRTQADGRLNRGQVLRTENILSGTQKVVDKPDPLKVDSHSVGNQAGRTAGTKTMILTFKNISKNGKNAFYTGAATAIRIPLSAFPEKQAPASIEVADVFAPGKAPKAPKVKLTKEERAALPKPTVAELARRAQEKADKLKAKADAAAAAENEL